MHLQGISMPKWLVILLLLLVLGYSLHKSLPVKAAWELEADEEGNITWVTEPKMASSGIKWRTQGFLIYVSETEYGHPLDSGEPYGRILVDDDRVSVRTEFDKEAGKYLSTFTIDAAYVKSVIMANEELYHQFQEKVQTGQAYIYLNNFFQSYRVHADGSETIITSNMYDIDTIRSNQNWANKNEWNSGYYNIRVPYRVTGNVHIKLVDSNGNYLGTATGDQTPTGTEIYQLAADGVPKKNPSLAFYQEEYAEKGLCESQRKVYVGETVTVSLPLQVVSGGKTYELYRSYYYQNVGDSERLDDTRIKEDRIATMVKEIKLGLKSSRVVGRYREISSDWEEPMEGEMLEGQFTEGSSVGVVAHGVPGGSVYEVEQGIPSSEALYTQVETPEYLAGYRFRKQTGTKTYQAQGILTWNMFWSQEVDGEMQYYSWTVPVIYTVPVERTYSYWVIDYLEVYGLTGAEMISDVLPGGRVKLTPVGYHTPTVQVQQDASPDVHIKQPEQIGTILDLGTMSYYGMAPPAYDATGMINALVGECLVRNDSLSFNGQMIMDGSWVEKNTTRPGEIETDAEEVGFCTMLKTGLVIPLDLANGNYPTEGTVTYQCMASVNPVHPLKWEQRIEDINPVQVHTPVVCHPVIQDRKDVCQLLSPEAGYAQLVLDTEFRVLFPTFGDHLQIPGYGSRDYGKYTAVRQVRFPFDVYTVDGSLISPGNWITVGNLSEFHLPYWVEEGMYSVDMRSISINAMENAGLRKEEYEANCHPDNYVAVSQIPVEISGRLYGFAVTDISDYPLWEPVFRREDGTWNGNIYSVGIFDENGNPTGREEVWTLPLTTGSHPLYRNAGVLKKGYPFWYQLSTVGDTETVVQITPHFWYVSRDGTVQMEADVYDEKLQIIQYVENPVRTGIGLAGKEAHKQSWQGSFYLPAEARAVPAGFDLADWCERYGMLDYQEDFWLKEGYLMVFFDVETLQQGSRHLSYINRENAAAGYCNMWKLEGGRVSGNGRYGAVLLYETDRSVYDDYTADVVY